MQSYDIIFFKSENLIGKLISIFTKSEYCHVGILMPTKDEIFDINFGKPSGISKLKTKNISVYRVNDEINNYEAQKWISENTNLKYDLGEILRYVFGFNRKDNDNDFICSTLVLDFIDNCTQMDVSNIHIVVPQDLIDLKLVTKI